MKKSTSITLGLVLTAGVSFACASEPDQQFMDVEADYQQMCVREQDDRLIRRPDDECPRDDSNRSGTSSLYWYYLGRAFGTPPAVGQPVPSGGTTTRPVGASIAKPPASGGFGVTKVSVGS